MSADLLTVQLYGDEGNPTTTRAELHRVRQILGDRISAKPYRLTGPFSADFLEVREHVLHGRTEEALALYSGPLLPASGSLAVEMLRDELHTMMRRAVLQSGGAALESWVARPTAPTTRRRSSVCSSSCPTTTRAAPSSRPGPTGWRPSSTSAARPAPAEFRRHRAQALPRSDLCAGMPLGRDRRLRLLADLVLGHVRSEPDELSPSSVTSSTQRSVMIVVAAHHAPGSGMTFAELVGRAIVFAPEGPDEASRFPEIDDRAGRRRLLPAPAVWSPAKAQARQETLLVVTESGPNNFDIHGVGTNRPGYEVSWNCYDRLMSHGKKTLADGARILRPRQVQARARRGHGTSADMSVTFKLRKNANFHDGTPITAKDVKWSFDRAVTVGGFPTFQMKAGSLEKPEQFVVVDDHTFRVDFIRKDKLTMPDLAVIVPAVYNSELVKKHATEKDPWGLEYTKTNIAGGGAYKVDELAAPAPRSSSSATTTGRAVRCRRCGASSGAWCRRPATAAR